MRTKVSFLVLVIVEGELRYLITVFITEYSKVGFGVNYSQKGEYYCIRRYLTSCLTIPPPFPIVELFHIPLRRVLVLVFFVNVKTACCVLLAAEVFLWQE